MTWKTVDMRVDYLWEDLQEVNLDHLLTPGFLACVQERSWSERGIDSLLTKLRNRQCDLRQRLSEFDMNMGRVERMQQVKDIYLFEENASREDLFEWFHVDEDQRELINDTMDLLGITQLFDFYIIFGDDHRINLSTTDDPRTDMCEIFFRMMQTESRKAVMQERERHLDAERKRLHSLRKRKAIRSYLISSVRDIAVGAVFAILLWTAMHEKKKDNFESVKADINAIGVSFINAMKAINAEINDERSESSDSDDY